MDNEITEEKRNKILSELKSQKTKWIEDGDIPREEKWQPGIIQTVADLIEKGNLSSAKKSFTWESDKLMTSKPVYDFMAKLLDITI